MKKFGLFLAALFAAVAMSAAAQAGVASAPGLANPTLAQTAAPSIVHKTHGWHCSVRRGYVRGLGYHVLHRHRSACHRHHHYSRCTVRHRVCRHRHGYGWRYRRCMRRRGCY